MKTGRVVKEIHPEKHSKDDRTDDHKKHFNLKDVGKNNNEEK